MKKDRGFTLVEFLTVMAIIIILAIVVTISFKKAISCKKDSTCNTKEEVKTTSSDIADKFDRTKYTAPAEDVNEIAQGDTPCDDIPDLDLKRRCLDDISRNEDIQNCIDRYSN